MARSQLRPLPAAAFPLTAGANPARSCQIEENPDPNVEVHFYYKAPSKRHSLFEQKAITAIHAGYKRAQYDKISY